MAPSAEYLLGTAKLFRFATGLFTVENGDPCRFYYRDKAQLPDLEIIIKKGLGELTSSPEEATILLCKEKSDPLLATDKRYLPVEYVAECVKKNKLLNTDWYRRHHLNLRDDGRPSTSGTCRTESDEEFMSDFVNDHEPKRDLRGRMKYTLEEDLQIIRHLVLYDRHKKINGNSVWRTFANLKVTSHTYQSMKARYLKVILPNLESYNIPPRWFKVLTGDEEEEGFNKKDRWSELLASSEQFAEEHFMDSGGQAEQTSESIRENKNVSSSKIHSTDSALDVENLEISDGGRGPLQDVRMERNVDDEGKETQAVISEGEIDETSESENEESDRQLPEMVSQDERTLRKKNTADKSFLQALRLERRADENIKKQQVRKSKNHVCRDDNSSEDDELTQQYCEQTQEEPRRTITESPLQELKLGRAVMGKTKTQPGHSKRQVLPNNSDADSDIDDFDKHLLSQKHSNEKYSRKTPICFDKDGKFKQKQNDSLVDADSGDSSSGESNMEIRPGSSTGALGQTNRDRTCKQKCGDWWRSSNDKRPASHATKRLGPWKEEEEDAFIVSVLRMGVGNWVNVKEDIGSQRSTVQLKDKWRNVKASRIRTLAAKYKLSSKGFIKKK